MVEALQQVVNLARRRKNGDVTKRGTEIELLDQVDFEMVPN
jgi:hypothetical protein